MAFVIPGIVGKPIHAHNFTRRFHRNQNILIWMTCIQPAAYSTGGLHYLTPRKGSLPVTYSGGVPQWAAAGGYSAANFPHETNPGFWNLSDQIPRTNDFGLTICMFATNGFTEPVSIRYPDGSRIIPRPNHNAATGLSYRLVNGDTTAASVGPSGPLNELYYLNLSYDSTNRIVRSQMKGSEVFKAPAPASWDALLALPTFNLTIGQGHGAQTFSGQILDVALWGSNFLANEADMNLVAEYMAQAYGI